MNDSSITTGEGSGLKSLFFNIAIWMSLASALLYTAGWSFAYHYFENFHVGLLTLEVPKEYYLIYSFRVIKDHAIKLMVFFICCYAIVFVARHFRRYVRRIAEIPAISFILIFITILAFFAFFKISYKLGATSAVSRFIEQKYNDYTAYPRVKIYMHSQADQYPSKIQQSLKKGCYLGC